MTIRTAIHSSGDLAAIRALYWQLDTHAVQSQPQHFRRGERSDEFLLGLIEGENSDFLLAELDGEIAGFSQVSLKWTSDIPVLVPCKFGYLNDFVVREDLRGQKIGTALMAASKAWARARGGEYLRLSVLPDNLGAQRFYARHGLLPQMLTMEAALSDK
ncbi:MAG: GNAT family N-acetyltransferase [Firmicutes bacterium]|nr:GNAT family N-acetyltransferase [Bacillota bacterium]